MTVASNGIVYVVDWGNDRIRKVMPDGSVSTLAGGGGNANVSYADGQGTNAAFSRPFGIVIDPTGNFLYVSESGQRIRKITTGGLVSTVAGSGIAGYSDGQGTFASFSGPSGLDMSISGDIFVADYGNHRIRKINSTGYVSTFGGTGAAASTDGYLTVATFGYPRSINIDPFNNVFVLDSVSCKLRLISPNGYVSTIVGSTCEYADGVGTMASMQYGQLSLDTLSSDLILADRLNNRIRRISKCSAGFVYYPANRACISQLTVNVDVVTISGSGGGRCRI